MSARGTNSGVGRKVPAGPKLIQAAIPSDPILTARETEVLERRLLRGEESREWSAMSQAGSAVGAAVIDDFLEVGGLPVKARILVLAGKGNNAGDALIAARFLVDQFPDSMVEVAFAFGERALRPLAARAWRELAESGGDRVRSAGTVAPEGDWDVCLDGIFGFQFRPPLPREAIRLTRAANGLQIRLRAAVDLPSGLEDPDAFRADFTYATGVVKRSLIGGFDAGRLRYLDLGFFEEPGVPAGRADRGDRVLKPGILAPLSRLREPATEKRKQGHLVVIAGSRTLPGAALMTVLSALQSGVGLVTAFVPESLAAAFAARAPEAMWVGCPETPAGGLAAGSAALIAARLSRATALEIGPGLGRETETLAWVRTFVGSATLPLLIDGDALQADIVRTGRAARILTPHAGEFARIAPGLDLRKACRAARAVVVLKGPVTRISDGGAVYHNFTGGPVLARGGSGDLLAGITAGLLAQNPADPLLAACRGAHWHGRAADLLARSRGQTAVRTSELLDSMAPALRECASCPTS